MNITANNIGELCYVICCLQSLTVTRQNCTHKDTHVYMGRSDVQFHYQCSCTGQQPNFTLILICNINNTIKSETMPRTAPPCIYLFIYLSAAC